MYALPGAPATLGESPLRRGDSELVFVDMRAGAVHRVDLATQESTVTTIPGTPVPYLGAVVEIADGGLAAVTLHDVIRVPEDSGGDPELLGSIIESADLRLNDAAVDPLGRLWVGSTSVTGEPGRGALHIWTRGSPAETVLSGLTLPNGIGWSPDGTTGYLVDSRDGVVLAVSLDTATGTVGDVVRFAETGAEGEPDGLAVAADGTVWVAVWDGACVRRYAPDGRLVESIDLPVTRPTACAFGDHELYITTARHGLSEDTLAAQPLAGRTLRLPVDVADVAHGRLAP